jgi:hypothetical protein
VHDRGPSQPLTTGVGERVLSVGTAGCAMGKSNRQRRAAKQNAARRRHPRQRPARSARESTRSADTRFRDGGTSNPFTRPDPPPSFEQQSTEPVERALDRLLAARTAPVEVLALLVEQELIGFQSDGLRKLDELMTPGCIPGRHAVGAGLAAVGSASCRAVARTTGTDRSRPPSTAAAGT